MPTDFPAWTAAYYCFYKVRQQRNVATVHDLLRARLREKSGRHKLILPVFHGHLRLSDFFSFKSLWTDIAQYAVKPFAIVLSYVVADERVLDDMQTVVNISR